MTDQLPQWDFDPVPVAGRTARLREALLAYCHDGLAPLLHLVQDTTTQDDVAELAMAMAKVYREDMFASAGRDSHVPDSPPTSRPTGAPHSRKARRDHHRKHRAATG